MKVLVTNDDGIGAPGLKRLVRELSGRGHEVYVVAPLEHMSGMGKAMRVRARYGEASMPGAKRAWWVDSTPASTVYIAINLLLDAKPDLVVSGINRGPNMGLEDFLTSGTIGAAIEAALNGVPGLASSLACDNAYSEEDYQVAAVITAGLVDLLHGAKGSTIVNLNTPPEPRGVLGTRLAWNNYKIPLTIRDGSIEPAVEGFRNRYWDLRPGSDVWAVMNGYASISYVDLESLSNLGSLEEAERLAESLARLMGGELGEQ